MEEWTPIGLATMHAAASLWRRWRLGRGIGQTLRQVRLRFQARPAGFLPQRLTAWLLTGLVIVSPFTPLAVSCIAITTLAWPAPARADSSPTPRAYRCDGDPLTALLVKGAMDEPTIPDPSDAPVPVGGVVVLRWRGLSLQLPRTNNAGQASFSDGKWWWSLEDPDHPRFRLRQPLGEAQEFACEAAA